MQRATQCEETMEGTRPSGPPGVEFDARAATPSKRAKGGRTPLGEVTNVLDDDRAELGPAKKHLALPISWSHGSAGHAVDGYGADVSANTDPSASCESSSSPTSFTAAIGTVAGLELSPAIGSPPTSPAGSNPGSALERSRVSCGSSSARRVSYGSSSVMSHVPSSPDSNVCHSPGLCSEPSPGPDYEIEEQIGEGGFGTVHRVRDIRTGRTHAMKLSRKKSPALREIQLMQAVRNPHVISCFEVVKGRNVVMDLMNSDLKTVIADKSIGLAEIHVKGIAVQIMKGIAAIHRHGYMHRDITTANVLVDSRTGVVKLGDFGIARTTCGRKLTPLCTTLAYRAPEGLHGAKSYTQAVDVWSAGCVIAEMFERKELFPGSSEFDMVERVLRSLGSATTKTFERLWRARAKKTAWVDVCGLPWMCTECPTAVSRLVPSASDAAHELLQRLLRLDPRRRPSADEALSDEFFTAVNIEAFDPSSLPFVRGAAEN